MKANLRKRQEYNSNIELGAFEKDCKAYKKE